MTLLYLGGGFGRDSIAVYCNIDQPVCQSKAVSTPNPTKSSQNLCLLSHIAQPVWSGSWSTLLDLSILHRPLFHGDDPLLQLSYPISYSSPDFLSILTLSCVFEGLLQAVQFFPSRLAIIGSVDGLLVGFLGGDFEL